MNWFLKIITQKHIENNTMSSDLEKSDSTGLVSDMLI